MSVVTFGCRLNALESDQISEHLERNSSGAEESDSVIVVNSCAVTGEAVRQAVQAVRTLTRKHPNQPIYVTGCAATTDPKRFAGLPGVVRVIPNSGKLDPSSYLKSAALPITSSPGNLSKPRLAFAQPSQQRLRTRAYVQIQQGCNHACTFCLIPAGRGPSRSRPIEDIVQATRIALAEGHQEIVFTGVDICSYGEDLAAGGRDHSAPTCLGSLVRALLSIVPDLPRLRLSSLDPAVVNERLIDAFASEPRLMPHAHLSVQSGTDLILKRMRRRHLSADLTAACEALTSARPGITFNADMIAGFPTETDEDFSTTCKLVETLSLGPLHVFPFSPRSHTPASRMPPVPSGIARSRARELRALGASNWKTVCSRALDSTRAVLFETPYLGKTPENLPVRTMCAHEAGLILPVQLEAFDSRGLTGSVIN